METRGGRNASCLFLASKPKTLAGQIGGCAYSIPFCRAPPFLALRQSQRCLTIMIQFIEMHLTHRKSHSETPSKKKTDLQVVVCVVGIIVIIAAADKRLFFGCSSRPRPRPPARAAAASFRQAPPPRLGPHDRPGSPHPRRDCHAPLCLRRDLPPRRRLTRSSAAASSCRRRRGLPPGDRRRRRRRRCRRWRGG